MSQALYRKWRPSRWEEIVGQQHIVQTLHNAVAAGREGHAYLFAGPRGTGKTSLARILAKAVNCLSEDVASRPCDECEYCKSVGKGTFLDLIEIDAASNTSVEDIRSLRDKINFSPNQGRYKVYIIDEVHMLSTAAFNALLKTLEEPPPHAIFILATTEVHKIPLTVLSRCQRHEFRRIPVSDIVTLLKKISEAEGLEPEEEALQLVARQSTGALRDAVSLLDQLSAAGKVISLDSAQKILGTATSQSVLDLVDAILTGDASEGLTKINATLDTGSDPRQFARQVVDYLRSVLLVRLGNADQVDTTNEIRQVMVKHADGFENSDILRFIRSFNKAATEFRGSWQPSLPLELAFVESLEGTAKAVSSSDMKAPTMQAKPESVPVKQVAQTVVEKPVEEPESSTEAPQNSQMTKAQWESLLETVKAPSPNTRGLLNSCRTNILRNGVLLLGFPSQLLKEKMEQPEHLEVVQAAAEKLFDTEIKIECVITSAAQGGLPPLVNNSGMVATGVRLGGEIVDVNNLKVKGREKGKAKE